MNIKNTNNKNNRNYSINSNSNSFFNELITPSLTPIKINNTIKEFTHSYISNEKKIDTKKLNQDLNNTYNNINNKTTLSNTIDNEEDNSNEVVGQILDTINKNSLSLYYDSESEFIKKIDSLNLKFYLETEKYLCNQNKKNQTQTSLFIILFKEINIFIEEIERLNLILLRKKYKPENIIKRTNELNQKKKEFQTQEEIIKALKLSQFNMETKLLQAVINENNLNKKIEILQKELEIYKNKNKSLNSKSKEHAMKNENLMYNSFQNSHNKNYFDKNNLINNMNGINISSMNNNKINININKPIKSKSPNSLKNKEYYLKFKKIKGSIDIKRNYSLSENKSKINNYTKNNNQNNYQILKNKSKNVINTDKIGIKRQRDMIYLGSLINKLNKTEKMTKNNSKLKLNEEKNNTIDLTKTSEELFHNHNYKKIIINNKNKKSKDESFNNYTIKKKITNNNFNDRNFLYNSFLSNHNNYNLKPTKTKTKILKNNLNLNKYISNNYSGSKTIEDDNEKEKEKYETDFNCFKIINNKKKNNENNWNINKIINKSIMNDFKNNRIKRKNIINILNSNSLRNSNISFNKKKF